MKRFFRFLAMSGARTFRPLAAAATKSSWLGRVLFALVVGVWLTVAVMWVTGWRLIEPGFPHTWRLAAVFVGGFFASLLMLRIFRGKKEVGAKKGATAATATPRPATTKNYFWTKLKFAWPWVVMAVVCFAGAIYLGRPEIKDHRFFPLLVLGVFCAWPSWRAFARIPYVEKNGGGEVIYTQVPTAGQFFKKIFISGPALASVITIVFYLVLWGSGNLN